MKRKGTSIIFVNDKKQILLFLRDDKPGIPYTGIHNIITFDQKDFNIYRAKKQSFVISP
jgi:hypothetical protein